MTTGILAALVSVLALGFVEGIRRFYPSRQTWRRLRRTRGRYTVRLMRERFEAAATRRTPRHLAEALICLVIIWVAASSLLDKRWYEVVTDTTPYAIVAVTLLRVPGALREIAQRMKVYERDVGEDPDKEWDEGGDGGPAVVAL